MLGLTPSLDIGRPVNLAVPLNRGLVSWWMALNQGPYYGGARFLDLCGKNHGTLTNGPAWAGATRPGGFGSINFDGVDDYVNCGDSSALRPTSITLSAWVRLVGSANNRVIDKSNATGVSSSYGIFLDATNKLTTCGSSADGLTANGATALSLGTWYHVALSLGSSDVRVFVNGVLDGSKGFGGSLVSYSSNPVALGAVQIGASSFAQTLNGALDDVRLYGRALSDGEVAALYATSRAGYRNELNWLSRGFAADVASAPPATTNDYFQPFVQIPNNRVGPMVLRRGRHSPVPFDLVAAPTTVDYFALRSRVPNNRVGPPVLRAKYRPLIYPFDTTVSTSTANRLRRMICSGA